MVLRFGADRNSRGEHLMIELTEVQDAPATVPGEFVSFPGSPFQLFQPYRRPGTSRRPSPSWWPASVTA
jgi:hypothetical protein